MPSRKKKKKKKKKQQEPPPLHHLVTECLMRLLPYSALSAHGRPVHQSPEEKTIREEWKEQDGEGRKN